MLYHALLRMSQPHRIAFLDRDGVINKNAPEHEYITRVEDFIFNPGIFAVLKSLAARGFEFVVLTNQRGIARGLVSVETVEKIHSYMKDELARHSVTMLDIFVCPHDNGVCTCRKPLPGLLEQACSKYEIDVPGSIFITDSKAEIDMGNTFGIGQSILVPKDHPETALEALRV